MIGPTTGGHPNEAYVQTASQEAIASRFGVFAARYRKRPGGGVELLLARLGLQNPDGTT